MITTIELKCGCAFTCDNSNNDEIVNFKMCSLHLKNSQAIIKELLDKSVEYENKRNKKTVRKGKNFAI